jgi:MoxR-like ATPase
MAILLAKGRDNIPRRIMTESALANFPAERRRAVVLIDEIDKAPRDMPNDILNEIERMEFRIPELFMDEPIKLTSKDDLSHRPIVIITSNAERELPEAFLRRCLYYHLSMPPFKEDVEKNNHDPNAVSVESIVASRFNEGQFNGKESLLSETISLFRYLRNHEQRLVRKPSLAEFLDWLRYLSKSKLDHTRLSERKDFLISMTTALLKNPGDQANIQQFILTWQLKQQGH